MNTPLLDGPARPLESVHAKFIVELVLGINNPRQTAITPQQLRFRERLMNDIMAQAQLRSWSMVDALSEHPAMRVGLADKLASTLDPGYLALTKMGHHLHILQQKGNETPGVLQLYATTGERFLRRAEHKQRALSRRGLMVQAGEHSEQVFTRWHAGSYSGWSLAGRCFIALEELRWGAFGDACRLATGEAKALLMDNLRATATEYLAQSINAAPATRHFYHQWLSTPMAPAPMDHKEMLCWLGSACDSERQPVSWSVTQTWQTIALGMPRLCSAMRLAEAMVDEIFQEENTFTLA
ncbi:diguanylate cyclase regulator RdcB family protein [Superficieibacter sp. HKU1]|uniref:diguanylate cyclase regulator RdcB family protein n=1 Tax=Superficieibacter sp. HKU1 TaxID=3031919 RepID=UPI0023E3126F|nr:diguanylate cyclase regulator RdcB family protein [Superficieibacter sp. HKU1]WES68037.1 diguanylate cyclase regulator RdcB family protein [Superficieibacter sp. HKU1]